MIRKYRGEKNYFFTSKSCSKFLKTSLFLFSLSTPASALELDWLQSGEINFRPAYQINNQPITDPQGKLLRYSDFHGRFYGLFKLQKNIDDLRLFSQLRPNLNYDDHDTQLTIGVDELYADYAITPAIFAGLGKRNIFTGVGLGLNPTDYFGQDKNIDNSLNEEARRDQRKGDYMVSLDWYLENASWSLYYAPRIDEIQSSQTRLLLRYNQLFEQWNTDFSGYLFLGKRPGVGMNLSKTVNDNWVMYSELSLRKGRDRAINNVTFHNDDEMFVDALVGSNYTFDNGVSFYLEYWHQGAGYSRQEWRDVLTQTVNSSQQLNTINHASGLNQLITINQGLTPRYLRQNYLFSRFSYGFNSLNLELSLVHILNIDDSSQFIRALAEKEFAGRYHIGFQVEQMLGSKDDEFGIRPWSTNMTLNFRILF